MEWALRVSGEVFGELGLVGLKRRLTNQGRDRVVFQLVGEAGPGLEGGARVEVLRGGAVWFSGVVVQAPEQRSGTREARTVVLEGPWWYLENVVYQQGWQMFQGGALRRVHKGRVILGQGEGGVPQNVGGQVREILTYARSCGAPIEVGRVEVDVPCPLDEAKDLSCAEAIQRVLRWAPDAVVWFDYAAGPVPIVHVARRDGLARAVLPLGELERVTVSPRRDRLVPAVILKYEKSHTGDAGTWNTLEVDAYPQGATGRELGALVLTVELEGGRAHTIEQAVDVSPVLPESPAWWHAHLPALRDVSDLRVSGVSRTSTMPNELVEGAVGEWMQVDVEEDVVRARLSYHTDTSTVVDREVALRFHATNAVSRTYRKLIELQPAEPTPVGLAERLYGAIHAHGHEGELVCPSAVAGTIGMGQALQISGGESAWATMDAVVQEIREEVDQDRTTVVFGPPKQLGAHDLVELTRSNRHRSASSQAASRHTGYAAVRGRVVHPTHARLESTHAGAHSFERLVFQHATAKDRKIVIDAAVIPQDLTVSLKEEYVSHNGVLKKRLVVASEPYAT